MVIVCFHLFALAFSYYLIISFQCYHRKHSLSISTSSSPGLTMGYQIMPHPFLLFIVELNRTAIRQEPCLCTAGE